MLYDTFVVEWLEMIEEVHFLHLLVDNILLFFLEAISNQVKFDGKLVKWVIYGNYDFFLQNASNETFFSQADY